MFRRFGLLMVAIVIAASPAAAQDKPVSFSIGGGYTGVYGAGADRVGSGGNVTLGLGFHVSPVVTLQGEYGWNGMKQKQLTVDVAPTPIADPVPTDFFADANMQYGAFNVQVHPPMTGKARPYFVTGLGAYYRPVTITTPSVGFATVCDPYWYVCYPAVVPVEQVVGSRSSTDFGMNFGAGVDFKMTDTSSVFFEVRYHYIWGPTIDQANVPAGSTPKTLKANGQFVPITFGFRF
jgi:opacity protein-like surface antigen